MKRSVTPLPSSSRTKDYHALMPKNMIVTKLKINGDVLGDSDEVLGHALPDRLHGLGLDGAVRLLAPCCAGRRLTTVEASR
jgi:hypothetical protein